MPQPNFTYSSTNADYENWVDDLYTAFLECSMSKKQIREFFESLQDKSIDKH